MENPFAKFTTRDWLYAGGAVASIVALIAFIYKMQAGQAITTGPGVVTDNVIPGVTVAPPGSATTGIGSVPVPNYLTYNMGDPNATSAPATAPTPPPVGADMSPNPEGRSCCCPQTNDCAGSSPLSTGNTASGNGDNSLDALLDFYTKTNPYYVQGQIAQTQAYAEDFAAGQTYSKGAVNVQAEGLAPLPPMGPIQ